MFEGWFKIGGIEVINVERLMTYIRAGYKPTTFDFESPVGSCEGLGAAIGDGEYLTPSLDEAPWFDPTNDATEGFAGVMPLSITGLEGTTRTANVVERLGNGGLAQLSRRTTRTISVQALLVGTDAAATRAGLQWLTTTLERACDPTTGCTGAQLEAFTICPSPVTDTEDVNASLVTTPVSPTDQWLAYGGTWEPSTHTYLVPDDAEALVIDGGTPGDTGAGGIDGGAADSNEPILRGVSITGGSPTSTVGAQAAMTRHLAAPVELTCLSDVVVTWTLSTVGTGVTGYVQVGAVDLQGRLLDRDPLTAVSGTDKVVIYRRQYAAWDDWRPAIWASDSVQVAVTVARRPLIDADACLAPYRRTYADVSCIAGPTVVETIDADDCDAKLLRVEWTWLAGDPHIYGDPVALVTSLPVAASSPPASTGVGVTWSYPGATTSASTACVAPIDPPSCAYDPTYPGFLAPPTAPVIADPGATTPTTYSRSLITIDAQRVPDGTVDALRFTFANNGTAKRGVRVRVHRSTDPGAFDPGKECDFQTEFWINYIDPGATLLVDGITSAVTAVCSNGAVVPARGVLRGPYRGAFDFPTMGCGGTYHVTVDVPSTQGLLTWSLAAAPREG